MPALPKTVTFRDYKHINKNELIDDVRMQPFADIYV